MAENMDSPDGIEVPPGSDGARGLRVGDDVEYVPTQQEREGTDTRPGFGPYWEGGGPPRVPAKVTRVYHNRLVDLCVFEPGQPPVGRVEIVLRQPGDDTPADQAYCEFRPGSS